MSNDADRAFWKSLSSRPDDLAKRIYEFNVVPARNAHSSHFQEFRESLALIDVLLSSPSGSRMLSRWLLDRRAPIPGPCWDFSEPRLRLAAFPRASIEGLLIHAGAAIRRDAIAHEIGRKRLQELSDRFGPALHAFAVKRAPLLIPQPQKLAAPPPATSLVDTVLSGGRWVFEVCFRDAPEGFLPRLEFLFPAGWSWNWRPNVPDEARDTAWRWLHRIMTSEIDRRSGPCFE